MERYRVDADTDAKIKEVERLMMYAYEKVYCKCCEQKPSKKGWADKFRQLFRRR